MEILARFGDGIAPARVLKEKEIRKILSKPAHDFSAHFVLRHLRELIKGSGDTKSENGRKLVLYCLLGKVASARRTHGETANRTLGERVERRPRC